MEVILLGTGSPLPDAERAGPSTLIKAGRHAFVVDTGRGVMMRMAATGLPPPAVTAVFITHLHSDHTQDLTDVITMRWAMSLQDSPLRVIGPPGVAGFIQRALAMMEDDIGYRMAHHDDLLWRPSCIVDEVESGTVYDEGGSVVTAALVDHAPASPALAFRFDHGGASAVVSGDTRPCEGLDRLCKGADVLVQNVIRRSLIEHSPLQRFRDVIGYHSSLEDAGTTAARGGVGRLVLTHLVPTPGKGTEADWVAEASAEFSGEVILGHDLLAIEV